MNWILVFVVPTILTTFDDSKSMKGTLVDAQTMTFAATFKTQGECIQAGNQDYTGVGKSTHGSYYLCVTGSVVLPPNSHKR